MIRSYVRYLKRSLYTDKYDIARPYHIVIDLVIKLFGLGFAFAGAYLLYTSSYCYFQLHYIAISPVCEMLYGQINSSGFLEGRDIVEVLTMRWLWGAGNILIALFISSVLVVRHLSKTLPDHLYLRCFAPEEHKRKRLNLEE